MREIPPYFEVRVDGTPATQGSFTPYLPPGQKKPILICDNKQLKPWRKTMEGYFVRKLSQMGARMPMFERAVDVTLIVILPRLVKCGDRDYPGPPDTGLDLDKLQRAVGDSLTDAKVIADDRRICHWDSRKRYAKVGEPPGIKLRIFNYVEPTDEWE